MSTKFAADNRSARADIMRTVDEAIGLVVSESVMIADWFDDAFHVCQGEATVAVGPVEDQVILLGNRSYGVNVAVLIRVQGRIRTELAKYVWE